MKGTEADWTGAECTSPHSRKPSGEVVLGIQGRRRRGGQHLQKKRSSRRQGLQLEEPEPEPRLPYCPQYPLRYAKQSPVPAQRPSPRCAAACRTGTQHGPAGSRPGTGPSRGQTAAGPGSGQRGESASRPRSEGQRGSAV